MSSSYSPIDESSYSENAGFDPATLYNNPSSTSTTTSDTTPPPPSPEPDPLPEPDPDETPSGRSALSRFLAMLADSRSALFLGLVLTVLAAYGFIVCLSYFMNINSDQSAMLNADYDPTIIHNAGGAFGARLAHTLIYQWLGIGAFIFIYYVLVCGLSLLKVYRPSFINLTLRSLLLIVAVSIIAGLVTLEVAAPFYWGGLHGRILNENLILYTGIWGAIAVSVILAGMVIIVYLNQLKSLINAFRGKYEVYSARQAERREERERRAAARRAEREEREARQEAERREAERREAERREAQPAAAAAAADGDDVDNDRPTDFDDSEVDTTDLTDTDTVDDESLFAGSYTSRPSDEADDSDDTEVDAIADEPSLFPSAPVRDPRNQPLYDPRAELSRYQLPSIDLLRQVERNHNSVDATEMEENKTRITKTLNDYGIPISHIKATVGPTVTLYEIIPAEGVRIAKIKRLEDDIALSLAALGIRIIAPIPGKGTIGIEVPNKEAQTVSMRSIIEHEKYQKCDMELPMAMGCTISNEIFIADLCKMPHLLVAGATGMGKSVGLNVIITSLLYKKHPSELKFVLVDPKMVEFSLYAKLERHYLAKLPDEEEAIITDPSKVVTTLNSLCVEMDNRYALLKDAGVRTIKEYNDKFCRHALNPAKGHRFLPYIVVIVDEFADLLSTAGKEVETPIARIAQKARAVGMHMILATQRPSTNVITGVIKANFPGRIAFRVFQMVDSRTIIDRPGANQLIGRGDMLFSNNGKIDRVQCAFIDTPEVQAICNSIDAQVGFDHAYELPEYIPETSDGGSIASLGDRDPLFDECARLVVASDTASTSSLQRRYSIGYNRAGKIMDQMEAAGIVGPSQGGKPRQVLVDSITLERILENN
ncbi:MAG: DNA translocase FtsK 4TM domain-containing protein [Duncaniella sp.]|nr:DNA translocase FtsK 4TM domain-containing protein [Duncaniella sp.]